MVDYIRNEFVEESIVAIRAGKKGQPQSLTQGGTQASGTWVFTANVAADDVLVVNGVTFTFVASGATGNQINVGVDLPTSLDNMIAILNGSAEANVALATYTEDGTDTLTASFDVNGVAGNAFTIAATVAAGVTVSGATLTGGQDTPSLSLTTDSHTIALTQDVDQDITLPDGVEFMEKTIVLTAKGGTGNAVITPTTLTGGTTLTADAADEFVRLQFLGGTWQVIANTMTLA